MKKPIYPHKRTCQSFQEGCPCDCAYEATEEEAAEWIEYLYARYAADWIIGGPSYKRESNYISYPDLGPGLLLGIRGWYVSIARNGKRYTVTGYSIIGCVQEALLFFEAHNKKPRSESLPTGGTQEH